MGQITLSSKHFVWLGIGGVLVAGAVGFIALSSPSGSSSYRPTQEPSYEMADTSAPSQPARRSNSVAQNAEPQERTVKTYPKEIAYGEEVDIHDYEVEGKMMIFDFTSVYCPPCREVAPRLERLHFDRNDVVVVKVNINRPGVQGIDFRSPVARKYGLPFVPYFIVMPADRSNTIQGKAASTMVYDMLYRNENGR